MDETELRDIPWPALFIGRDGEVSGASDALQNLLAAGAIDRALLESGFELRTAEGDPLKADALPWRRAARRESFDEDQVWYDRANCRRLLLHVRARPHRTGAVLWLEDLAHRNLAMELAELVGSVSAGLLQADAVPAAVHAVVDQVSRALFADVVALFTLDPAKRTLELQGSSGLPLRTSGEGVRIGLESHSALCAAVRTRRIQHGSPADPDAGGLVQDLQRMRMRTYVAVPLIAWGEVIAVLGLAWRQPLEMEPLEERRILAVSSACALALSRAWERARERKAHERLQILREAALAMEKAVPLRTLLSQLLDQACRLAGAREGALGTLADDGSLANVLGDSGAIEGLRELGRSAQALREALSTARAGAESVGLASLCVPLRIHGETFGVFYLRDRLGAQGFTAEDRQLVELFSAQASLLVGYARQMEYIEEQRRLLDAVLNQAPNGILFFSEPGGDLILSNPAAQKLLGNSGRAARFDTLRRPDGVRLSRSELPQLRALRGEEVHDEEVRIERPDGESVSVLVGASPVVSATGAPLGATVMLQDISAWKALERLREEFAAVIAHDLRNPLQTILLQIEVLLSLQEGGEVVVPLGALERVKKCGQRLGRMVNDLLDASRIEAARLTLAPKPLPLADAVAALVRTIEPTLAPHPISVELKAAELLVAADPVRLDQVVTNLLVNAAKYSQPESPISVTVRSEGEGGIVSVEDHGPGIGMEDRNRLFDRFYQSRRAREQNTGLGLGLYIVKGLVEAHRGRIWFDTMPGRGTTFHVWLPSSTSAAAAPTLHTV